MKDEENNSASWLLLYGLALLVDFIGYLTGFLGIGLISNRILGVMAGATFAFWFYVAGIHNWGWKLFLGGGTETIPFLGDFIPAWTLLVWRVHKGQPAKAGTSSQESEDQNESAEKNMEPHNERVSQLREEIEEGVAGEEVNTPPEKPVAEIEPQEQGI